MLSHQEYQTLASLRNKIAHGQNVHKNEVIQYLKLIQKEGPKGQREIQDLFIRTNTNNLNDLAKKLSSDDNLLEGLVYVGLGILLGWALISSLKE